MTSISRKNLKILILQHPKEKKRLFGTTPLILENFPEAQLKTGLSWKNLDHAWGGPAGHPGSWLTLAMGAKKVTPPGPVDTFQLYRPGKKEPLPPQPIGGTQAFEGILLLDGNFSEAKTLWWRNPWLLKLWKAAVLSRYRSQYSPLRQAARKEGYSTFEALALSVGILENSTSIRDGLLEKMKNFVEKSKPRKT